MDEHKTRQLIIDKRLAKAGWNVKDPSQVTEELDIIADENIVAEKMTSFRAIFLLIG